MKSLILSLFFSFYSCHAATTPVASTPAKAGATASKAATTSVSGRIYQGAPTGEKSYSGCEGCGEPGEFTFDSSGRVTFIFPGSDIIESGTWSQSGSTVTILNDRKSVEVSFVVEDGGKSILDTRYSTRYFLQ